MRIAVYSIAKNEAKFVERWFQSCKDADEIVVVDTGSTDGTVQLLEEKEIDVYDCVVKPWRFDTPRNFNLNLIPADVDICICLDMDEVLVEGWREIIETCFAKEQFDRLRYTYIWSWNADGTPGLTYHADKIHARHGFIWKNPVHEALYKDSRLGEERQLFIENVLIEHHPDITKSRSSYLELLAFATKEDPYNDRNAHYYGRDLFFAGQYKEAISELERHLGLPTARWDSERAASYRYMGDCYWALGQHHQALQCFVKATLEAPKEREAWVSRAQAHRHLGEWEQVQDCCETALYISVKPSSYMNQPWAWGSWPQQMLNEAKLKLGVYDE